MAYPNFLTGWRGPQQMQNPMTVAAQWQPPPGIWGGDAQPQRQQMGLLSMPHHPDYPPVQGPNYDTPTASVAPVGGPDYDSPQIQQQPMQAPQPRMTTRPAPTRVDGVAQGFQQPAAQPATRVDGVPQGFGAAPRRRVGIGAPNRFTTGY